MNEHMKPWEKPMTLEDVETRLHREMRSAFAAMQEPIVMALKDLAVKMERANEVQIKHVTLMEHVVMDMQKQRQWQEQHQEAYHACQTRRAVESQRIEETTRELESLGERVDSLEADRDKCRGGWALGRMLWPTLIAIAGALAGYFGKMFEGGGKP